MQRRGYSRTSPTDASPGARYHPTPSMTASSILASLFEPRHEATLYGSVDEALDAVGSGAKAMWLDVFPEAAIDDGLEYLALMQGALSRGLYVVHRSDRQLPKHPHVYVFVLRPDEMWRARAYDALRYVFPFLSGG